MTCIVGTAGKQSGGDRIKTPPFVRAVEDPYNPGTYIPDNSLAAQVLSEQAVSATRFHGCLSDIRRHATRCADIYRTAGKGSEANNWMTVVEWIDREIGLPPARGTVG